MNDATATRARKRRLDNQRINRRKVDRRIPDRRTDDVADEVMPRVLVALIDTDLRRSISITLRQAGFCVSAPSTAVAARDESASFVPDVVIVDAHMNTDDDQTVVDVFRTSADQYVLCIAGEHEHEVRATALRDGADDAISCPIHADELTARCQALLRRPRRRRSAVGLVDDRTLQVGPLEIDTSRHELRIDGTPVAATRIEFSLLEQLCRRPLEVATRSELLDAVWGPSWGGDHHIVDVHLSNLRRKLDAHTDMKVIHTVRGVGFRLSDEVADHTSNENSGDDRRLSVA